MHVFLTCYQNSLIQGSTILRKCAAKENFGRVVYFATKHSNSLNLRHRILAEGGIPPAIYENQRHKWELGERFGEFGVSSGVDLRKLWPTVEEVEEMKSLKMYRKAGEAFQIAENAKRQEQEMLEKRKAEIQRNLESYSAELKAFQESIAKTETEQTEKDKQLEKRIREIQEYFGYWIDPKDPRFEVMFQQKELEEKKAAKKAKKEAQKAKHTI